MSQEYAYSCSGCNRCEKCNTCELCDRCTTECETAQQIVENVNVNECNNLRQFLKKDFAFSPSPTPDSTIMSPDHFNKATWDSIIKYYNKGVGLGKVSALLKEDIPLSSTSSVAPFSAAEYNRVSSALNGPYSVSKDTPIYGEYFTALENAVNNYEVKTDACDFCNTACDCESGVSTNCVACQDCNSCQRCVSQTGCYNIPQCCGCNGGETEEEEN